MPSDSDSSFGDDAKESQDESEDEDMFPRSMTDGSRDDYLPDYDDDSSEDERRPSTRREPQKRRRPATPMSPASHSSPGLPAASALPSPRSPDAPPSPPVSPARRLTRSASPVLPCTSPPARPRFAVLPHGPARAR